MENIENHREFLNLELVKRAKKNSAFSQRAFAKVLGLSPGELSEILNGKRKLSVKKALHIAEKLSLNPEETLHFINLAKVKPQEKGSSPQGEKTSQKLSMDIFEVIGNWYCFAVINLSECEGFQWSKDYIAKKLGISMAEARDALQKLLKVGLIEEDEKLGFKVVSDFIIGPDQVPSSAVRKSHFDLLNKAIVALEESGHEERNITGIGLALNSDEYKSVVKDIAAFRRELVKKYGFSNKNKNKVYQLELALFELTQGNTND
jgi:uncharacterized protein (TIGR02147 family)